MNKIVILAAGKGTRMNSDLPKVLVPLNGRAMILYLLDSIAISGVDGCPVLIVSPDNIDQIKEALSEYSCDYVLQEEQLGTGHALSVAKDIISDTNKNLLVFYGDHPFIQPSTIKNLCEDHSQSPSEVTMMTSFLDNFDDWRNNFKAWGRIERDGDDIANIIEYKDANENQRLITEVNPGLYCFDNDWLWENIATLKNNNKQKEYYLTDLVKIATGQGIQINDSCVAAHETVGINSVEELDVASIIYNKYFKDKQ